jgi:hypothetical protein
MTWQLSKADSFNAAVQISGPPGHRCPYSSKSKKINDLKLAATWIWENEQQIRNSQLPLIVLLENNGDKQALQSLIPTTIAAEFQSITFETVVRTIRINAQSNWSLLSLGCVLPSGDRSVFELDSPAWESILALDYDRQWREGILAFQRELDALEPFAVLAEIRPGRLRPLDFSRIVLSELKSKIRNSRVQFASDDGAYRLRSAEPGWGFWGGNFAEYGHPQQKSFNYWKISQNSGKRGLATLVELAWKLEELIKEFSRGMEPFAVHFSCKSPLISMFVQRLLEEQFSSFSFPNWNNIATSIWGWNPVHDLAEIGRRGKNSLLIVIENISVTHVIGVVEHGVITES